MKALFLSIAIFISSIGLSTVSAKGYTSGQKSLIERKELNLSEAQKKQIKESRKNMFEKIDTLKKDEALSKEQKIAKSKEIQQTHQNQINKILTPEQQQTYAKLKEERSNRQNKQGVRKHKKGNRHHMTNAPKHRMNKNNGDLMSNLNLSDTQKEQLKSLRKDHRAKSTELRTQQRAEILNILTAEQKAKLEQNKTQQFAKRNRISPEGAEKLQALRENFKAEKSAVERSRIAPEAQQQRIKELKEKFVTDKKEIIKQYKVKKQQAS